MTSRTFSSKELTSLKAQMKLWAGELGFSTIGVADTDLSQAETRLIEWLADGRHGDMHYMPNMVTGGHNQQLFNPAPSE